MTRVAAADLTALYLEDETAWLDRMAVLVAQRRFEELDCENLREHLNSMAIRDRREVRSRLTQLLAHLLKWDHQPERRGRSWVATRIEQRRELRELLESRTLYNHAVETLDDAYQSAWKQAAAESDLPLATFSNSWDGTVRDLIAQDADDALLK